MTLKSIPYPILFAMSVLLIVCTAATASESKPTSAPQFALPGLSGERTLDDYRGQYLYVDFWASWCGPCRQSFPWMNDMQAMYGAQGLKIIAINLDEKRDDAHRFLNEVKVDVDIAFDANGDTAQAYRVKGMPSSYLINPRGEIVFSHIGFRPLDKVRLEAKIAELMGESI
ncbi:MAG: TlpA disulfide reductase family protein [Granulosicoccaceae bacterium]